MNQASGVTTRVQHQPEGPLPHCADPLQAAPLRHPEHPSPDHDQVLRNLFRSAPLGLYQADLAGRPVTAANGAGGAAASLEEEPDQRAGYLHPQDRRNIAAAWKSAMERGEQWSQQFRYRWADGRVSWLHAVIAPLRDGSGVLIGYHGCNTDVTEQVESQAELAISEDRHRVAAEAASLGIWDLDVSASQCYISPYSFEMLGYRWGQLQTSVADWTNIMHPESLEGARRVMDDCIAGKLQKFELEVRLKTNEGKWRWFRCKGKSADRDPSGKALRVIGTLEDITQAKMMEHLLRMEHDLLDLITATSPVGIMFVEPEGNVAFANPRAEKILGLCKQQITQRGEGSPVWSIVAHDKEAAEGGEVSLGAILKTGCTQANACFGFSRLDGSSALLSISTAPFLDEASKVSGTVVTLEDVTEQKLREQVLADSDRLLRETQRIAQLGSYVLDLEKDSWSGSDKLYEILGIDESYPRTLRGHVDLVHENFKELFIEGFTSAVKEASHFEMEYKITRPGDGAERWVTECCELTRDSAGKKLRMVGTIKDITERKASEEAIRDLNNDLDRRVAERTSQLAAAKREIESFSYSVSHDLRAPLRHINSYSSILVDDFGPALPEEARVYLERICTASSRMGKQIDDLLTLTRVGRAEMKRQTFSISRMAGEVSEMLRDGEPGGGPSFIIQQGVKAHGDSALVRLVLQNLLGNAVKYASRKPCPLIEFGQTSVSGKQTFFVRDNGVGFDMAYADKLFHPFQRLHGSEFEGTGIGLATVRRIIERHGGSIRAEAKENEGATFYFTLS